MFLCLRQALARPGYVQPVGGARSRTVLYRALYAVAAPLYPLLRRLFPRSAIDSDELGRALLQAGLVGAERSVLEVSDLQTLAEVARRPSRARFGAIAGP